MVYTINQVSNETREKSKGSIWKELVFAFMGKSKSPLQYFGLFEIIFFISLYSDYELFLLCARVFVVL